jgi:hypothetical protein
LVIPVIVKSFEHAWVRRQAIVTMTLLCREIELYGYASRIIHPLVRVLPIKETRAAAMDLFCELIFQLNQDYVKFIPLVDKMMRKHGILHTNYGILVSKLMNKEKPPRSLEMTPNDRYNQICCLLSAVSVHAKLLNFFLSNTSQGGRITTCGFTQCEKPTSKPTSLKEGVGNITKINKRRLDRMDQKIKCKTIRTITFTCP